jgi:hypothetical protein
MIYCYCPANSKIVTIHMLTEVITNFACCMRKCIARFVHCMRNVSWGLHTAWGMHREVGTTERVRSQPRECMRNAGLCTAWGMHCEVCTRHEECIGRLACPRECIHNQESVLNCQNWCTKMGWKHIHHQKNSHLIYLPRKNPQISY